MTRTELELVSNNDSGLHSQVNINTRELLGT